MKSWSKKLGAGLALFLAAAAIFIGVTGCTVREASPVSAATNQTMVDETVITGIYEKASPAVVEIIETSKNTSYGGYSTSGQGSGFLIDTEGHILTNYHVVEGATTIKVNFSNGSTETATVVGKDPVDDLAVIKVDPTSVAGIIPLTLTDSAYLKPGLLAVALGSPYGLTNSISVGVVSGLNRQIDSSTLPGVIQTDANIQPGNSGGPLLNSSGLVIGINTAFEGQGTGIGYAVPSSVAIRVLPDLIAGKTVERPWIGISGMEMTQSLADEIGITYQQGVYVVDVVSDGPAAKANLVAAGITQNGVPGKTGDIITAVDGQAVKTVTDLQNYLVTKKVGDNVTLSISRGGSSITVQLTLAARPAESTSTNPSTPDIPWPWGNGD
jgi:S1-C subfamily serine protease